MNMPAKSAAKKVIETRLKLKTDVLQLEPFGLTAGMDKARPVMLFREIGGESILPVWLSPLDAGIAITQQNAQAVGASPHDVALGALKILGVKPEACHFSEVKGHQQYAELTFSGSKKMKTLKVRADHAVSFCLQAKVKFSCTREHLQKCREVEAELGQVRPTRTSRPQVDGSRGPYLN